LFHYFGLLDFSEEAFDQGQQGQTDQEAKHDVFGVRDVVVAVA
jgi:hypothetical protein